MDFILVNGITSEGAKVGFAGALAVFVCSEDGGAKDTTASEFFRKLSFDLCVEGEHGDGGLWKAVVDGATDCFECV